AAAWAILVQVEHGGSPLSWTFLALAVVAAVAGWIAARARREGFAFLGFAGFGLFGVGAIFAGMFPLVLPSTVDAAFDLTVWNAANGPYTLGVMTVVAAVSLPVILLYQAWSYWIFRKRVTPGMIPEVHIVLPAVLRAR
ncbi:MAG TPA: cytochrome d ubiquinol oxidase subunit II, partial [Microbacterium sp.]|nr:cytochrome d ubiquinol oxidase subunit II [Microbacterium sp.]